MSGFDVPQPWGKQALRGAEVGWEKMFERLTGVVAGLAGRVAMSVAISVKITIICWRGIGCLDTSLRH